MAKEKTNTTKNHKKLNIKEIADTKPEIVVIKETQYSPNYLEHPLFPLVVFIIILIVIIGIGLTVNNQSTSSDLSGGSYYNNGGQTDGSYYDGGQTDGSQSQSTKYLWIYIYNYCDIEVYVVITVEDSMGNNGYWEGYIKAYGCEDLWTKFEIPNTFTINIATDYGHSDTHYVTFNSDDLGWLDIELQSNGEVTYIEY